jgi:hypothetical protein
MKRLASLLLMTLSWPLLFASAQSTPARPRSASPQTLPPFSGTWLLNLSRSKVSSERPTGTSRAVIQYDGKNWRYIHIHWNRYDQQEDKWQVRLLVGSSAYHVEKEEPLTFRSRISRQGDAMVLSEYLRTDKGQRAHTTTRYTLADGGNTLIEDERTEGPLGPVINRWVLERETGPNNYLDNKDDDKD